MAEQCLMAASTYFKDFHTFLPSPRKDILRIGSIHDLKSFKHEDRKCMSWMMESNQYVKLDSTIKGPVLIGVQEIRPDSALFSFGIAEQCTRQKTILRFLMSGSSEAGRKGIDFSLLTDLVGLDMSNINMNLQTAPLVGRFHLYEVGHNDYQHSIFFSKNILYPKTPLVDFIWDLASRFKATAQPDRRISPGTRLEMKDLLSIIEDFYPSKDSVVKMTNKSLLVPHFTRIESSEARTNIKGYSSKLQILTVAPLKRTETSEAWENTQGYSPKLQTATVAPLKSPKRTTPNPLLKKRNNSKAGGNRDIYKRSSLHACESLLSLILDKRQGKTAILSLKKSDPELPQFLSQFSAGIAGTGLAVLFSVGCKVAGARVPFCASKLLSTGCGFGLVWLSWAVNKLRDSIICISKNTSKVRAKEKEMIRKVDESMNQMFFRAATVVVFAVLRFA